VRVALGGAGLVVALVGALWWRGSARAPKAEAPTTSPETAASSATATGLGRGTADEEAWKLYQRGLHEWQKRGPALLEARDLFKQAVDRDPTFARAWLGLADTYAVLHHFNAMTTEETFPKAKAAAEKALALDPSLAGAHVDVAYVNFFFEREWRASESEFRAALSLDPADAKAHQWFSKLLTSEGRFTEALSEVHEAQRLDPLAPMLFAEEVWILRVAGRPEEAVRRAERANLEFADFVLLRAYWALALIGADRAEEARRLLDTPEMEEASPLNPLWLAYAESALGRVESASQRVARALTRYGEPYVNAYYRAYSLARCGKTDAALDALALSLSRREEQAVWMNVDPDLAPLRGKPRFAELLRRAGFGT
jgi:Tfp pilus assembly protein PilF